MRRSLLLLVFVFCIGRCHAQYVPNSGQSFQFYSMYNPAFSGIEQFTTIKSSYAYRWAGFDGAPKSINVALNTRFKRPLDLTTNSLRLSNQAGINVPKRKLIIGGLGVSVFQTTYGQVVTSGGSLNLSIHYPLSKKVKLAVGLTSLIESTKLDFTKVTFRDPLEAESDLYKSLVANGSSKTDLNVRAGFLLYAPTFYVGFSYFPLVEAKLQKASLDDGNPNVYIGSFQSGYSIVFSPDFSVKPSISGLVMNAGGVNFDYGVKAYIQRSSWAGMTYRDIKSAVISVGLNISYFLSASYSYEKAFGKFGKFNDGSHELVLSLRLNNFKKQDPYTW